MANYQKIVTTAAGLTLLENAAFMGSSIQFTAFKTGSGSYDGTEDLAAMGDLKSVKQTFGIGSVSRKESAVVVRVVINNNDLTEGYDISEMGLYATDPDTGSEILYAIILTEDYLPPYAEAPTSQALEMSMELTESEAAVTFTAAPMEGVYAPAEALAEHVNDKGNPHGVTAEQVGARPNTWLPTASEIGAATTKEVNEVKEDIVDLKKSVSDGKELVADAITAKGVETATDATFGVMAENILLIETGGGELHGATITGSVLNGLGATVELSLDGSVLESVVIDESGAYAFVVQNNGTYTITATLDDKVITAEVSVTSDNVVHKDMVTVVVIDFQEQLINYLMTYDAGSECVDVTDGWLSTLKSRGSTSYTANTCTVTRGAESIKATLSGDYKQKSSGFMTNKMINLSEYSMFGFLVTASAGNAQYSGIWFDALDSKTGSVTSAETVGETVVCQYWTSTDEKIISTPRFLCADLSEINASKYLGFTFQNNLSTTDMYIELYNATLFKEDNWQEWLIKGGLNPAGYTSVDDIMANKNGLITLMYNKEAVDYMLLKCTGTVMASVIQSANALEAIRDSRYNAEIFANEHWNKFLRMVGEMPEMTKVYLYDDGAMDGYTFKQAHCVRNGLFTNGGTYLKLTTPNNNNAGTSLAQFELSTKIDLTNYSVLHFEGTSNMSSSGGNAEAFTCGVAGSSLSSVPYWDAGTLASKTERANTKISLNVDISNITSQGYIFGTLNAGSVTNKWVNITQIWIA